MPKPLRHLFALLRAAAADEPVWDTFIKALKKVNPIHDQKLRLRTCILHLRLPIEYYQLDELQIDGVIPSRRGYAVNFVIAEWLIQKSSYHMLYCRAPEYAAQLVALAGTRVKYAMEWEPIVRIIHQSARYHPIFNTIVNLSDFPRYVHEEILHKAWSTVDEVTGQSTWISEADAHEVFGDGAASSHVLIEKLAGRSTLAQTHFVLRHCWVRQLLRPETEDAIWAALELDPGLASRRLKSALSITFSYKLPVIGDSRRPNINPNRSGNHERYLRRLLAIQRCFMAEKIIALAILVDSRWFRITRGNSRSGRFMRLLRRLPRELQVYLTEMTCRTKIACVREAAFQWAFKN